MKGARVYLDYIKGREIAVLMIDGQLEDVFVENDAPSPGTVYRAIADRPIKGQGGLFLKTPDGSAFLRQVKGVAPGQELLVQVSGYAEPGKAIPVTQKLLFKSRYAIVTPQSPGVNVSRNIRDETEIDRLLEIAHEAGCSRNDGVILRSAAAGADADALADDLSAMLELARAVATDASTGMEVLTQGNGPHELAWRDWAVQGDVVSDAGCLERDGVLDMLRLASGPATTLPQGASFFVEPTRAFVAVDVNTGPDGSMAAALKANLATARALPRVLRLRGLGGQIVVDVAPLPKKDRRPFETALRQAFRADDTETALVGWTPLGHYELQRKRARAPLSEALI